MILIVDVVDPDMTDVSIQKVNLSLTLSLSQTFEFLQLKLCIIHTNFYNLFILFLKYLAIFCSGKTLYYVFQFLLKKWNKQIYRILKTIHIAKNVFVTDCQMKQKFCLKISCISLISTEKFTFLPKVERANKLGSRVASLLL